jgi:hypothetical protein
MPFITVPGTTRINVDQIVMYCSCVDGGTLIKTERFEIVRVELEPEQLDALIRDAVRAEAEMISLVRLEALDGHDFPDVRRCRVCGCTDDHACDGGCEWVEPDLCSACNDQTLADSAARLTAADPDGRRWGVCRDIYGRGQYIAAEPTELAAPSPLPCGEGCPPQAGGVGASGGVG